MKKSKIAFAGMIFLLVLSACKKEKNPITNPPVSVIEEELITTLKITFVDSTGVNPTVIAMFQDLDGPGGNEPTAMDTIRLKSMSTYHATIEVLNESISPSEDITVEILEEADSHLFCFAITGASASVSRTDSDGTYEVGVTSKWTIGGASIGTAAVILKHQPGIKNGSCNVGETDIEVVFPIVID